MAAKANLTFVLGETWPLVVRCNDGAGAPIADDAAVVQFRVSGQDGEVLLDLSSADAGVVITSTDPLIAAITVTPAMQTTAEIAARLYDWEVRAVLSDAAVSVQALGSLNVQRSLF